MSLRMYTCIINSIKSSGKLPIQVDDAQQVFTTTALELSQPKEEKIRIANHNNHHDEDESAPPLPSKALAGWVTLDWKYGGGMYNGCYDIMG